MEAAGNLNIREHTHNMSQEDVCLRVYTKKRVGSMDKVSVQKQSFVCRNSLVSHTESSINIIIFIYDSDAGNTLALPHAVKSFSAFAVIKDGKIFHMKDGKLNYIVVPLPQHPALFHPLIEFYYLLLNNIVGIILPPPPVSAPGTASLSRMLNFRIHLWICLHRKVFLVLLASLPKSLRYLP